MRSASSALTVLALALLVGRAGAEPRSSAEKALFDALASERLVEGGSATAGDLAEEVRATSELLVAGEADAAAARLYLVVEGPRYAGLAGTPDFEDAEYQLGHALTRGGAVATGRGYLERIAARAGARYGEPALRRLVDVALDRRDEAVAVARLEAANVHPAGPLAEEIDYLRGRAAHDAGHDDEAETVLRHVGPSSRFYSSAIYLRGVIAVLRGDLSSATSDFCVVAEERPGDPLAFVVDGRYWAIRDLARLALGRVAHEERRFGDAFYHYFTIPDDSRELPHALFESAWSMLEQKRYSLAGRLIDELLARFPASPLAGEARLLGATLRVKTCRFAAAEREVARFLADYEPVERLVAEARRDPAARQALARRLLDGAPAAGSVEARLVDLLAISPAFRRLDALARGLRADAGNAATVETSWSALATRLAGEKVQPIAAAPGDAASLLEATAALGARVAEARDDGARLAAAGASTGTDGELKTIAALEERRARLLGTLAARASEAGSTASLPAAATSLAGRVAEERSAAAALRTRVAALAARLEARRAELLLASLAELETRLAALLRHARLAQIDAVVGEKKHLERQIHDLAAGRFPPSLANRLSVEGLIGDDEEYWPPEEERWADEYEGYK